MVAGLVVDCDLDLVRLVDIELVPFVDPSVVPGGLGATFDSVFDLYVDKSFGSSAKATGGCVINIGDCMDS